MVLCWETTTLCFPYIFPRQKHIMMLSPDSSKSFCHLLGLLAHRSNSPFSTASNAIMVGAGWRAADGRSYRPSRIKFRLEPAPPPGLPEPSWALTGDWSIGTLLIKRRSPAVWDVAVFTHVCVASDRPTVTPGLWCYACGWRARRSTEVLTKWCEHVACIRIATITMYSVSFYKKLPGIVRKIKEYFSIDPFGQSSNILGILLWENTFVVSMALMSEYSED